MMVEGCIEGCRGGGGSLIRRGCKLVAWRWWRSSLRPFKWYDSSASLARTLHLSSTLCITLLLAYAVHK